MRVDPSYEIIDIADEYMAIPVGKDAQSIHGIITLSEPAAFLLKNMKIDRSTDELVELLMCEYEVDLSEASKDVNRFIRELKEIGLIK